MSATPLEHHVPQRERARVPAHHTGAWIEGDPSGDRLFAHLGELPLESGSSLDVTLAYEQWGTLNEDRTNAVLVLHALTGDSHVIGGVSAGHATPGWWEHLVGPGKAIDTTRYCVIAANVLGGCQGSTGPSSLAADGRRWGSRFPRLTTRDQVAAEHALMRHLGLDTWALVIGGSMGGMRALEWAVTYPEKVEACVVVASAAQTSGDVIAFNSAQLAAIDSSPGFRGGDYYDTPPTVQGPEAALGVARRIAHITYRCPHELNMRFSNQPNAGESPLSKPGDRYAVSAYLDHHATKLSRRFDAGSYLTLVHAMNTHDVGRDRGGAGRALASVTARTLVVAVDSDRLFPPSDSEFLLDHIPGAVGLTMHSMAGHDGFLVNDPELNRLVQEFLTPEAAATA